jgi:acetaldehyde dehydrogenase (acetylating)
MPDFNRCVETCIALLRFGGMGHTAVIYSRNDARTREYAMRVPAYRVLVNTPSPQGSTGITTNVFPAMTLGCGAAAGNSTSDNVGPLHLINIKRLAFVVRKPEEAFEMPLDYHAASYPGANGGASSGAIPIDRSVVAAAVERYLASRGIAAPAPVSSASAPASHSSVPAWSGPSCACNTGMPSPPAAATVISNAAADVVDRFLSQRSGGSPAGGYG